MVRQRRDFTKDELDFIKENYQTMSLREMARHLKREHSGIANRVRRLQAGDDDAFKVTDYSQFMGERNKAFTAQEDEYILTHQHTQTYREIGRALHRDRRSVEYRLKTLTRRYGVGAPHAALPPMSRHGKAWTEDEMQYLSTNYGCLANETIARVLGRTVEAVVNKAQHERMRKEDGLITTQGVAEIMHVRIDTVRAWVERGWLAAKRSDKLKRGRNMVWVIEPSDFERFLLEHPQHYDYRRIDREMGMVWYAMGKQASGGQIKTRCAMWTQSEVRFLLHNYGRVNVDTLAAQLGRTPDAVRGQVMKLKRAGYRVQLKGYRAPSKGRLWTRTEVALLRAGYATTPPAELAKALRRSKQAVTAKALALGLHAEWRFPRGRFPGNREQRTGQPRAEQQDTALTIVDIEYEREVA